MGFDVSTKALSSDELRIHAQNKQKKFYKSIEKASTFSINHESVSLKF